MQRTLPMLFLPLLALAASAQESTPPLESALLDVIRAAPADRKAAVDAVIASQPERPALEAAVARLTLPCAVSAGWHVRRAVDPAGVERPYHLYVPASVVAGGIAVPLVVDMHGGVMRPEFIPDEQFAAHRDGWTDQADAAGFLVAMPLGRADCAWWSGAGVSHVRAVVRDVARVAPVDPRRIVGTGFSDGGSGSWFLAMHAPEPFSALMPMNGHPVVASAASGEQLYLQNAALTPLFVAMTQDDPLYPGASVLPHVQTLFDLKASVHLVSYPTGGHTPSYGEHLGEAFMSFIVEGRGEPLPDTLAWWTATPMDHPVRWLVVEEIDAAQGDADLPEDVDVPMRPGRVRLGFEIETTWSGRGVKVRAVQSGSLAESMGMREGDVVTAIDGSEVGDRGKLVVLLGAKRFGEPIAVDVLREETTVRLTGDIPAFEPRPSYPRAPEKPTSWIRVERKGNEIDVRSHRVRRVRLLLSPARFDLDSDVRVVVNGVERFAGRPEIDLRRALQRFADQADPGRFFPAELVVEVPAARTE